MDIIYIILQGFFAGIVATWLFELILKNNKRLRNRYYHHHAVLFGYHVHHSLYGLIAIVAAVILFAFHQDIDATLLLWFGIGVITVHTFSDGKFVFIEKFRKQ